MDAAMAERVNKLARSLKDLHLATTFDEAYKRAEEILAGSASQNNDEKTLNELMEPLPSQQKSPELNTPVEEIFIEPEKKASDSSSETQEPT